MTPQEKLSKEALQARSEHAERLLRDPLLTESFANLRIEYFERWLNSKPEDTQGREVLFHAARAIQHVETHLGIVVANKPLDTKHIESMQRIQSVRAETLRRSAGRAGTTNSVKQDVAAL